MRGTAIAGICQGLTRRISGPYMFKALNKVIQGEPPATHKSAPSSFHISDLRQIAALLIQAYKAHILFSVSIPGHQGQFTTALLGIYDEHGFIVLDELTPRVGHKLLLQNRRMHLSGRLAGVDIRLTTELIDAKSKAGVAYYKARMPEDLYYQQRREDFRVPTSGAQIIFHALRGEGGHQIVKGHVHDLSRKGLGVILDDPITLEKGEILPSCSLSMEGETAVEGWGGGNVSFSLEVCFSASNDQRGITRMGGRFDNINSDGLRKVSQLLNQLERAQARRLHGT